MLAQANQQPAQNKGFSLIFKGEALVNYRQQKVKFVFYSHLKNLMEIVAHITASIAMTIIGIETPSIGKPSEVACSSFIPCVNGIKSATL